jgi:hypothetical protein
VTNEEYREESRLVEAKKIAQTEIDDEDFKDLVDREKLKIREKKTFWEIVFPFKVTITRIDR